MVKLRDTICIICGKDTGKKTLGQLIADKQTCDSVTCKAKRAKRTDLDPIAVGYV